MIAVILFVMIIAIPSVLVFLLTPNKSEIMVPGNTVMTVDGTKISVGFFNYFYNVASGPEALLLFEKEYEDFDASKSFSEQIYDKETNMTWHDFFVESANEQISKIIRLSNEAQKNGIVLLPEQEKAVQEQLDIVSDKATQYGVFTNDYSSIVYGEFVGKATLKKILEKSFVAQNYYEYLYTTKKPSDAEISQYFDDNKDDFFSVSFEYFVVDCSEDYETQISLADEVLERTNSINDFDTVLEDVFPVYDDWGFLSTQSNKIDSLLKKDANYFAPEIQTWLYSNERYVGEKVCINVASEKKLYIIIIEEPAKIDEEIKCSVREIFIETTEEYDADKARELCDDLENRINNSDNPEYTFAVLADAYMKDYQETKYSGGMVGKIAYGESEEKINSWIFNESRKNGDVISISGERGYYLIYFSDKYKDWEFDVEQELISQEVEKEAQIIKEHKKEYAYDKYVANKETGSDFTVAE